MHFASQAHRDKLNFKIKTLSIHYPLLVTMGNYLRARHDKPLPKSHYGSRCEPGTGDSIGLECREGENY